MNLSPKVTRLQGAAKLWTIRNSPTILTTAGVASMIASTVLAVRATAKATEVLPTIQKDIEQIKDRPTDEEYTEHDKTRDLVLVYGKTTAALAQVYLPSILTGAAGIACIFAGHNMMVKRQASLLAAYSALDAGFKAYRSRVKEAMGEDKELELYRGVRRTVELGEDGEPCEILHTDENLPSPYARFFDELSPNFEKTAEYNLMFLRAQQQWANDRLRAYGYVFLNEVYEALGLPRSQAGQIVGWRENGPNSDGYIDFGLYQIGDESSRAFVNGIEPVMLLDFNVDGPITI